MTVIAQDDHLDHLTAGAWAACGDIDFFFFKNRFLQVVSFSMKQRRQKV